MVIADVVSLVVIAVVGEIGGDCRCYEIGGDCSSCRDWW